MSQSNAADDQLPTFTGTDSYECEHFIKVVRQHAFANGKHKDYEWVANHAATAFEGDALRWHTTLDEDTQNDWRLLQKALLERYPAPSPAPSTLGADHGRTRTSSSVSWSTSASSGRLISSPSVNTLSSSPKSTTSILGLGKPLVLTSARLARVWISGESRQYSGWLSSTPTRGRYNMVRDMTDALRVVVYKSEDDLGLCPLGLKNPTSGYKWLGVCYNGEELSDGEDDFGVIVGINRLVNGEVITSDIHSKGHPARHVMWFITEHKTLLPVWKDTIGAPQALRVWVRKLNGDINLTSPDYVPTMTEAVNYFEGQLKVDFDHKAYTW